MKNRLQHLLESDSLFPHILSASTWDAQGFKKDEYLSPCLANDNGYEAGVVQRIEAEQTRLAYMDADQRGLKEFYSKNVIKLDFGEQRNALFYLGFIKMGYLTIVADQTTPAPALMSAGKRIREKLGSG